MCVMCVMGGGARFPCTNWGRKRACLPCLTIVCLGQFSVVNDCLLKSEYALHWGNEEKQQFAENWNIGLEPHWRACNTNTGIISTPISMWVCLKILRIDHLSSYQKQPYHSFLTQKSAISVGSCFISDSSILSNHLQVVYVIVKYVYV